MSTIMPSPSPSPSPAEHALRAAERAARAIPPAWPLAASVAVNPFLGQMHEDLAAAGARLARVAGARVAMDRTWYARRFDAGEITDDDLEAALGQELRESRPQDIDALKRAMRLPRSRAKALPTVAELAAQTAGFDWPALIAARFGIWAAGYFDQGQALWEAQHAAGAYTSWRRFATYDLTPEISGLARFASRAVALPLHSRDTLLRVTDRLGLAREAMESYFHRLLVTLGGWAQHGRYLLWQAELAGEPETALLDLLAIRLVWEEALLEQYRESVGSRWLAVQAEYARPVEPAPDDVIDSILQSAAEHAAQRRLAGTLASRAPAGSDSRPALQAAFCIDVRSEVFRRALEAQDPGIRTLGFAGFFGLGTAHRRFASDVVERRLPVLLNPVIESRAGDDAAAAGADLAARYLARAKRAWGRFKLAAVSSFAFVEASGLIYVFKLVRDALGLSFARSPAEPAPVTVPPLEAAARVDAAESVLRAMSLTGGFAPLVLLLGHGARVANNPHASTLNCGACGGYSGEVNARLLASLLNDAGVRRGLADRGIALPADTLFVAGLHDTTTDWVRLYADDRPSAGHARALEQARRWLENAGHVARTERAIRLPGAARGRELVARSRDWSQVRPEWGLAGCQAFIAAPRERTRDKFLQGRAFLHDYDWQQDEGFAVLESILTAPVVVASWISLQYYGSTVAPELFGAGNKLLHNVTGGIGVVEGNGGLLRTGLPWQSVHDGRQYIHEPLRLTVCIEAPRQAITTILERHAAVRQLFDNGWLSLFTLDAAGRMAFRYAGRLGWVPARLRGSGMPRRGRPHQTGTDRPRPGIVT